jgi:two-component system, sensor histidine kinase and response regulator
MNTTSSANILVIEDDSAIRATLIDILELNGHKVIHAINGLDGVALARRHRPDVILTDISMPGLDGFELIRTLHADELTRQIPIIIVSASVEPERMRRGMDLGAEDFIIKPFTEDQVLRSIHARLEKKALLDELDAFAHTVAHDLKNPIAVVSMRAQLLRSLWDSADDAALLQHVVELDKNTARLNNIVDELLVLAGVGRQTVQPKPVEMDAVVQEALGRVENLVQKTKAQIDRPSTWPTALGHAPWIAEVWTNYLSNAMKYGGNPPGVRLGADAMPERTCVRFWVQDNGPGLTAEQQGQLFKQFSRMNETRASGHGLGLSIVRRITEKLGGSAGVESQPGAGSRFWFELPIAPSS